MARYTGTRRVSATLRDYCQGPPANILGSRAVGLMKPAPFVLGRRQEAERHVPRGLRESNLTADSKQAEFTVFLRKKRI